MNFVILYGNIFLSFHYLEYDGEVDEWYYQENHESSPRSDEGKDQSDSNSINDYDDDDDDDDDYGIAGDEIIQLDNEMLASALEDLCVQKTQKDVTESSWNYIREDSDITDDLHCPLSQDNLQLGLRFGKAEVYMYICIYVFTNIYLYPCMHIHISTSIHTGNWRSPVHGGPDLC
jgi:hypothetical protein